MSNHRNLSLDRSKHAWDAANLAKDELSKKSAKSSGLRDESAEQTTNEAGGAKFKEYVVLVKNLPANISNSGLGQTLAFLKSKGKAKENLLLDCIEKWLVNERKIYPSDAEKPRQNIIQQIQNGSIDQYRWATSEVTELITWLKLHSSSLSVKNKPDSQTTEPGDDDEIENSNTDDQIGINATDYINSSESNDII